MPPKTKYYYVRSNYVPSHLTVDLGNSSIGTVGAAFSSRMVFNVLDESGRVTKGFFTANSNVSYSDELQRQIESTIPAELREKYKSVQKKIFDELDIARLSEAAEKLLNPRSRLARDHVFIKDEDDRQNVDTIFRSYLSVSPELLANTSKEFDTYLDKLCRCIVKSVRSTTTHVKFQGQALGSTINRRNNAMSDCAELLGLDGLIAKSAPMTIKHNGQIIHGSFMNVAEGISNEDLVHAAAADSFGCGTEHLTVSASGYRAMSNMQILDYICGNVDRHLGNMFYTVENVNGKPQITGIQGIDNDSSFGRLSAQGDLTLSYMSNLNDIKVIDKALADRLVKVSNEELERTIRPAGLSAEEVRYALVRLDNLRDRINNGTIMILDGLDDANWNSFNKNVKARSEITTFIADRYRRNVNIFGLAGALCDDYNSAIGRRRVGTSPVTQVPTGVVTNVNEEPGLRSHLEYLTELRARIKKPNAFTGSLDYAIAVMSDVLDGKDGMKHNRYPEFMTGEQRAVVIQSLIRLRGDADDFVRDNPLASSALHFAKSAAAYCRYAIHSVNEDAFEADKIAASRAYADVLAGGDKVENEAAFKPKLVDYPDNYNRMIDSLSTVDKWYRGSTKNFKDLVSAINRVRLAKANPAGADWEKLYGDLHGAAKNYHEYKTKQERLSLFEHRRIGFANLVVKYTEDVLKNFDKQRDINKVTMFRERCTRLSTNLSAGGSPEATERRELAVFNDRANFINGFTEVVAIADKYERSSDVRALCCDVLTSEGVTKFEQQFTEIHNKLTGGNSVDFYAAAGIDDTIRLHADELLGRQHVNSGRRPAAAPAAPADPNANKAENAPVANEGSAVNP